MKKLIYLLPLLLLLDSCRLRNYLPTESPLLEFGRMEDGYKICVIGDGGTGGSRQYLVADVLKKEGCDQVRYVGDVIYGDGISSPDDPQFMSKFYEPYREMLEAGIPFFMMMGNHDFKSNPKAWIKIAERYSNIHFQNFWYAETWDDVCFLTMEPFFYKLWGQEKWLRNIKKEMPNCKLTISGSHYPYKSSGAHGDANFSVRPFMENHVVGKTDVYIAGHDHNLADEGLYKGTRLLVSGSAGKTRPLGRDPEPGNFAAAELGYLNLIIRRDGDKVWADYEFVVVPHDDDDLGAQKIPGGSIEARGWR